jgi:hypothetical protein
MSPCGGIAAITGGNIDLRFATLHPSAKTAG